jgi:hypothetical protein
MSRYVNIDGERVKLPMFPGDILHALLDKMRERQSWCPYCGGEMGCESECVLDGIWFKHVEEPPHKEYCKSMDPDCEGGCW